MQFKLRGSGYAFFFFGYSFPFCRSTKKKKVTENDNVTNWRKRKVK